MDYSQYTKTIPTQEFTYTGTHYFGQGVMAFDPIKDYELVPLGFLKRWAMEQDGLPVGPGTLFPNVDPAANNKCVYVNSSGVLTFPHTLNENDNAQKVIGYLRDGRIYMNGHFMRRYTASPSGSILWVQSNGGMSTPETNVTNTWSVKMGHVIAGNVVYISIDNQGLT